MVRFQQPAGGIRQEPLPDAEAVLNVYIYDYCVKRGFKDAAKAFAMESDLARFRQDYPHIASTLVDSAETFLMEWWSSFWDLYSSKAPRRSSAADRQILPQVQPNASDSSQSFSTSAAAGNSNSVTTGQPRASGVASSSFPTSVSPPALPSDYSSFSGDNSQLLQYRLMNRQFLLQAVQQHGLQGREPNSLTPEEKDKITQTVYELQHRHRAQAQFFADSQRRMDQSRQQAQEQQEHFSDSPLPSHGSMRPTSKRDDQVDLSSPAPTGNARHHSSSLEISEQQQDGKASFAGKWSENSQGSRSESDAAKLMNGDSGPQRGGQDQSAKKVMQNNGGMVAPVGWENLSVAQRQRYLLQRQLLLQQQSLQQQRGWLSQQQSSDGGVVVRAAC
ncbi:hypothetical protein DFJ73DRAFT_509500 [Zopfochytrium polystomum]|nr:hypothetical protein DFJ73DRAFT_509500 [Zopfochytrium polystomum]